MLAISSGRGARSGAAGTFATSPLRGSSSTARVESETVSLLVIGSAFTQWVVSGRPGNPVRIAGQAAPAARATSAIMSSGIVQPGSPGLGPQPGRPNAISAASGGAANDQKRNR